MPKSIDRFKVALVVEGEIATTRLIERLFAHMKSEVDFKLINIDDLSCTDINNRLLIFCRISRPDFVWLPAFLSQRGIRYVYYTDDNFWELDDGSRLADYYQHNDVRESMDAFILDAYMVLTNSDFLAQYLRESFVLDNVVCVNAFFDFSLLDRAVPVQRPVRLRIGYAGGYREKEFEFLTPVLARILHEYRDRVEAEFIGWVPDELKNQPGVRFIKGIKDYARFIDLKRSRGWSIGLSPLLYSPFSASKTNNKYREYGACGIPCIYSNVSPYADCVVHGVSGLLVNNDPDEWFQALECLIEDRALREKLATNAFIDVRDNYNLEKVALDWLNALKSVKRSGGRFSFRDRIFMWAAVRVHSAKYLHRRIDVVYKNEGLSVLMFKIVRRLLMSLLSARNIKRLAWLSASVFCILASAYLLRH